MTLQCLALWRLLQAQFHDFVLVHIAHHAAPCVVPEIHHARAVYCRFQHWDNIKGHLVLQDEEGKRIIDFINPYLRVQLASTFGLKQGGSCKKSAWIEDHVYAGTSDFFITRCYSANCMTIIRHHAFVFASLYVYHLHGCCLIPSKQVKCLSYTAVQMTHDMQTGSVTCYFHFELKQQYMYVCMSSC